ncbi:MAG: AbrB/MazE/SpoVT family DNA-binding domain-containing protein [bacterium]
MYQQSNNIEEVLSTVKIGTKHQVVIPNKIFSKLGLIVGDFLTVKMKDNDIMLKPTKLVPKEDLWFHSKEWQDGETQADKDIAENKVSKIYDNIEGAISDLDS